MRGDTVRASAWMTGLRLVVRGIGLLSTVILARLLAPEDFGVIAMAMLAVGLVEVLANAGLQMAIIRHPDPRREHLDSAWTGGVLLAAILGTVLFFLAPLAQGYFDEPRLGPLIQFMALHVYLRGFENIGTVMFRRELDFAKDFRFGVYKKLLTFTTTITLALVLQNYWALAIGFVVGQLFSVALSYGIHPYRPRFCVSRMGEIWGFSLWVLVNRIGVFFQQDVDRYVVGGVANSTQMGYYTVSGEVAMLPTSEILVPVSRALFPIYSKLASDPKEVRNAYLNVLSVVAVICTSAGAGLALVAEDLVLVMLGPQWVETAPLLGWLALSAAVSGYVQTVYSVFNVMGRAREAAVQSWILSIAMLLALVSAASYGDIEMIAAARLGVVSLLAPLFFIHLMKVIPLTARQLVDVTWRPVVAAAAMSYVLPLVPVTELAGSNPFMRLPIEVVVGAIVYGTALMILWLLAGRPGGVERAAIRMFRVHMVRPAV